MRQIRRKKINRVCSWAGYYSGQLRLNPVRDPLRNHMKCIPELSSEGWVPETLISSLIV